MKTYQKVSIPKSRTTNLIKKVGYTQLGQYAENNRIAAGQKPTRKQSVLPEGTVDTIGARLKVYCQKGQWTLLKLDLKCAARRDSGHYWS
jgi:hypothetical protein